MLKNSTTIIPYNDIDYELRVLIKLINNEPGIETVECCCGHGKAPCQIWCIADDAEVFQKFMHKYFYCNSFWEAIFSMSDKDIDNNDWNRVHFLIRNTSIFNNRIVPLAISDLTKSFYLKQNNINF